MLHNYKIYSKAKINLFLHIIGKNNNDYHLLESMVCFTNDIYDIIEVSESNDITLEIKGEFKDLLSETDNIILKAANFLRQNLKLGAKIILTKNIPIAAGIGGGSSNAASIIKLLIKFWNLNLDHKAILNLQQIGADVPCCFYGRSSYFSGIGEIIEPISNFPKIYLLLVNPNKPLYSIDIFKNFDKNYSKTLDFKPKNFFNSEELVNFLYNCKNDMQKTAINFIPEIIDIINTLKNQPGCHIAQMSGSGTTCFGLFKTKSEVIKAYNNIKSKSNWWVNYTSLS